MDEEKRESDESTAAWQHPPVVDDPDDRPDELDSERVERTRPADGDGNADQFQELSAPPSLSGGLFEDDPDGDAVVHPGEPIYFRASEGMLSGTPRRCYAVTTDALDRLTR